MYTVEFQFESKKHFDSFKEELIDDIVAQNDENALVTKQEDNHIIVSVKEGYILGD